LATGKIQDERQPFPAMAEERLILAIGLPRENIKDVLRICQATDSIFGLGIIFAEAYRGDLREIPARIASAFFGMSNRQGFFLTF
jgi:hypothetical protein